MRKNGTLTIKRTQVIPKTSTARPTNDNLWVNGQLISNATIYKIDGSNYFKLRDLGNALGFDVDYVQGQGVIINTKK